MKRYFGLGLVSLAAVAFAGSVAAAAPTVTLWRPVNNQTLSGKVGLFATAATNTGSITKVDFWLDGHNNILIKEVTSAPYEAAWKSNSVPDGLHTIGVEAFDSSGNTSFQYALVHVLNTTGAVTCQDLEVYVQNKTSLQVVGGFWGSGLGSAGWVVGPVATSVVTVPAGVNSGTSYALTGVVQLYGAQQEYVSCGLNVPVVNKCPQIGVDAYYIVSPSANPTGAPTCKMGLPKK